MTQTIYPHMKDIFNALHYTPFQQVKVVILGQDPYHGPNQAHGLSFSVQPGVKQPPSLVNIFKELQNDLGYLPPQHGYLVDWTKQGVLLLNTVLTVRKGQAHSHRGHSRENFTNRVITTLHENYHPIVDILWASAAQRRTARIQSPEHYLIQRTHPRPVSAYGGFCGSQPISRTH